MTFILRFSGAKQTRKALRALRAFKQRPQPHVRLAEFQIYPSASLLAMPPEILDKIYYAILDNAEDDDSETGPDHLKVLLICRKIYQVVAPLFFSFTHFDICHSNTAGFTKSLSALPPQLARCINSIGIHEYLIGAFGPTQYSGKNLAMLLGWAGLRPKNLVFYVTQHHIGLPSRDCFHFPLIDGFGRQILDVVCGSSSIKSFQLYLPLRSYGWYLPTVELLEMDSSLFTSNESIIWEALKIRKCADEQGVMDRRYPRAKQLLELECGIRCRVSKYEWTKTRTIVSNEDFSDATIVVQECICGSTVIGGSLID